MDPRNQRWRRSNNIDIYILEGTQRGRRFTFQAEQDSLPVWSPDGSRIVFRSIRKGVLDLFEKPADGAGDEELLIQSTQSKSANDWSPDGRFILYHTLDPSTDGDLWIHPLDKKQKPYAFLNTRADERAGQFSPDGRWVAYQSNQTGRIEIYVRPFPGPGGQWQVSSSGGLQVRWRPDGKELYYVAPEGTSMAVPIVAKDATLEPGDPVPLFQPRMAVGPTSTYRAQYDVAPNGRFLINVTDDASAPSPITLLLNWAPPAK
jgi:Tol biopolymer transport system component